MEMAQHSAEHGSTVERHSSDKQRNNTLLMIGVTIAIVVSTVAIILSLVSLTQTSSRTISIPNPYGEQPSGGVSDMTDNKEEKIWLLNVDISGYNYGYIDEATGELRGFSVDVINAVCQIARKNCELVYDSPQRCWKSVPGARAQGGEGLFGGYYDGCVGIVHTYDGSRTFRFSDPYTDNVPAAVLLTLTGNSTGFDWENLTGKKIGFVDGFVYDEHCLARTDHITGNKLTPDQIKHYSTRQAAQQGLRDNEVDAIFDAKRLYLRSTEFEIASGDFLSCVKAGFSVMTRKDSRLIDWWNPAFAKLVADTSQWTYICNDLTDEHGHVGGGDATSCVGI